MYPSPNHLYHAMRPYGPLNKTVGFEPTERGLIPCTGVRSGGPIR